MEFLVCVGLLVAGSAAGGKKPADEPRPIAGVEVVLRLSVKELDPLKPGDSFLECLARNRSDRELVVPVELAGGFNREVILAVGGRFHRLTLVYWGGPKEQKTTRLPAGKDVVVFKASLKDILLLGSDAAAKPLMPREKRYYWGWNA
jgi:hypothetical protein